MIFVSEAFDRAWDSPVQHLRTRIRILDRNFQPVVLPHAPDGDITADYEGGSGSISLDSDQAVTRTASLTLDNSHGYYLPSPYGAVWFDKVWELSMGLVTGGHWVPIGLGHIHAWRELVEWCPVGMFVVQDPESSLDEGKTTVSLTLQDLATWMTEPYFFAPGNLPTYTSGAATVHGYPAGSFKTDVLADIASRFGFPPLRQAIHGSNATLRAGEPVTVGDAPLELFRKITGSMGWISFIDARGYIVARPRPSTTSRHVVARYSEEDSPILGMSSTWQLGQFRNAVYVIGGSGDGPVFTGYAEDDRVGSPTAVDPDMDGIKENLRVLLLNDGQPDPLITSQAEADTRARQKLEQELSYAQDISWPQIGDPRLEIYDVLELEEERVGVSDYYSLRSFSFPFGVSGTPATGSVSRRIEL